MYVSPFDPNEFYGDCIHLRHLYALGVCYCCQYMKRSYWQTKWAFLWACFLLPPVFVFLALRDFKMHISTYGFSLRFHAVSGDFFLKSQAVKKTLRTIYRMPSYRFVKRLSVDHSPHPLWLGPKWGLRIFRLVFRLIRQRHETFRLGQVFWRFITQWEGGETQKGHKKEGSSTRHVVRVFRNSRTCSVSRFWNSGIFRVDTSRPGLSALLSIEVPYYYCAFCA